jgi:hypothetical protein
MSCDGNQNVHVKTEELPDIKVEDIAEPVTLPVVQLQMCFPCVSVKIL